MAYKKTNEVYFGDTFVRPDTIACYSMDGNKLFDARVKDCDLSYGTGEPVEFSCSCDLAPKGDFIVAKSASGANYYNDFAVKSNVTELQDAIVALKAQIDDLKKNFEPKKGSLEWRSALKTLNYKREI